MVPIAASRLHRIFLPSFTFPNISYLDGIWIPHPDVFGSCLTTTVHLVCSSSTIFIQIISNNYEGQLSSYEPRGPIMSHHFLEVAASLSGLGTASVVASKHTRGVS